MLQSALGNMRLVVLSMALIIVAGLGAIATIPQSEDPLIILRFANIITPFPGASAERVEALVSDVIEDELGDLNELKLITSVSRPELSIVSLEVAHHISDMDPVWSRVRSELQELGPLLPVGSGLPSLESDKGLVLTAILGLTWQGAGEPDIMVLSRYARELERLLMRIPGTEYTEVFGAVDEEILVSVQQSKIASLGIAPRQVVEALRAADAKFSSGQLDNPHSRVLIEVSGAFETLERIRQVPLTNNEQGYIYRIGDLAEVRRSPHLPPEDLAYVEGERGVMLGAQMSDKFRIDGWDQRLDRVIEQFMQNAPANLKLTVLFKQKDYTEARMSTLVDNILLGFAIVVVVLFLTLGLRAALLVAIALPLSVMFTLWCMKQFGLPLHQMSVTGLVVALGIMVDNAIVLVVGIQQRCQAGMARLEAVVQAVKHYWLPLLGSTLTTILTFMPIVLLSGPTGEFVRGIAISVILSLIGSYFISHTIVAALAGRLLAAKGGGRPLIDVGLEAKKITVMFRRSVSSALTFPWLTIALVTALSFSGFFAVRFLTEQFFPASDRDMFHIEVYLPPVASLARTEKLTGQIESQLRSKPDIEQVSWMVGNNFPKFYYNNPFGDEGSIHYAQAMIKASSIDSANRLIPQLQKELDRAFPEAQIFVRKLEQGPPFKAPIEFRIIGPNLDQLKQLGEEARQLLTSMDHVIHTRTTLESGLPKIWVKMNEQAALLAQLRLADVADQLRIGFDGEIAGSILEATESLPVRVRVEHHLRQELTDIADFPIGLPASSSLVDLAILNAYADFELLPSRGAIPRRDGERENVVEGYLEADILPHSVLEAFKQKLAENGFTVPAGYRIEFGGESEERDDAVQDLESNLGVLLVVMVLVIVLTFNSFRNACIIFAVAVQAAGLGLLSIFIAGYPFGFNAIIALMGLVGLAINAAIVILSELKSSEAVQAGDQGAVIHEVAGCGRHITSTTITTAGGFLPLMLEGGAFWPPFAVVIVGGTVFASIVSFYFVPAAFVLLNKRVKKRPDLVSAVPAD